MRYRAVTITAIVTALMMIAGVALAGRATDTEIYRASSYRGDISAQIGVCAEDASECPENEGSVKVRLFKLKNGSWVKIAAKKAKWAGMGGWQVTFEGAPRSGKCKLVARFSGTSKWEPSKDALKAKCDDREWTYP